MNFDHTQIYLEHLGWAIQQGLEYEWLQTFFTDYVANGFDVLEACYTADREWDL